jgi:hypothetical protein
MIAMKEDGYHVMGWEGVGGGGFGRCSTGFAFDADG